MSAAQLSATLSGTLGSRLPEDQRDHKTSSKAAQQEAQSPVVQVSCMVDEPAQAINHSEDSVVDEGSGTTGQGADSGPASVDSGDMSEYTPSQQGAGLRPVQIFPEGWQGYYGRLAYKNNHGYIQYTTTCTCTKKGTPVEGRMGVPDKFMRWAIKHGDHRPEYEVLKPLPDERYPDKMKKGTRQSHPGYINYQKRLRSLGFYTSVCMLERAGFCLPKEAQKEWNRLNGGEEAPQPNVAAPASEDGISNEVSGAGSEGAESGPAMAESGDGPDHMPDNQGAGVRKLQEYPPGFTGHYGSLDHLKYKTVCTCRDEGGKPLVGTISVPHTIMKWAKEHGDHRPEYKVLKPLPDQEYPDGLNKNQRRRHPGYKKYQQSMHSLGFYTSVAMLEEAGFCLPDEQQKRWDKHCKGEAPEASRAQTQTRPRRKRGRQASAAEDSSDGERSWEAEASDGSEYNGSPGHQKTAKRRKKATPAKARAPWRNKRKPDASPEQLDAPEADKGKRRRQPSPPPRITVKGEEAGPSAPEQDALASLSELPCAAAPSTPGASPVKAEVVDLTADSPRASSCTQLPGACGGQRVGHTAPHQASPGHAAAAASGADARSPTGEAAQQLPTASASLSPAIADTAPGAAPHYGAYTLGDVIADVTQLKAVEAQIAVAGVQLDFDQILQCLHSASIRQGLIEQQYARIGELQARADALQEEHEAALADLKRRAEKSGSLMEFKDAEIRSLRSQLEVMQS